MKARLNQWGFKALSFSLAALFRVADLMPAPQPEGRHRGVGRATRAGNRALAREREKAAMQRFAFTEMVRVPGSSTVGVTWMDFFDVPPLPQRRFRALAPRALAAAAINAREALRRDQEALQRDQEAIGGDFDRAVARLVKEREVS